MNLTPILIQVNLKLSFSGIKNTNNYLGIFFTKPPGSQLDSSTMIDQNVKVKRTTSLVSLPNNEFPKSAIDQLIRGTHLPPSLTPQNSAQRQLQPIIRRRQPNGTEIEQINNTFSSINENDTMILDKQIELNPLRSFPKYKIPSLPTKMATVNKNDNLRKVFPHKLNTYATQQPLRSIESILKQRSIDIAQENHNQSAPTEHINEILKRQFNLPFEKNKRL
jgi:hypothetical protein